ncbi:MAG: hypothetical protein H6617_02745 [Bdellovibrionaceae bacterium]|nr:hypothetical protein [Bdellovibrionales bacterium]MCB9253580.1 hypothetical protein [Pseudobdellovibrionaceae bacterium]
MFYSNFSRIGLLAFAMLWATPALGDLVASKAQRIFFSLAAFRLSSAPESVRTQVLDLVREGRLLEAAAIAANQRTFFEKTVRHWSMKKTNGDGSPYGILNDFVATVIGHTRDNGDFRELLYGNFTYFASPSIPRVDTVVNFNGVRPHSSENNLHYLDLDNRKNLFVELVRATNQFPNGVRFDVGSETNPTPFVTAPTSQTAGLLTTRRFIESAGLGGTNRRFIKYVFEIFLRTTLDEIGDAYALDHRVRKDVDRFPGGDMNLYNSKCRFCHAGMDALAGAFAKWDYDRTRVSFRTGGGVHLKYNQNDTVFPDGAPTNDSSWENLWLNGPIKWNPAEPLSGVGARQFGRMIAYSDRLPVATAISVFEYLCKRTPNKEGADAKELAVATKAFEDSNYNLRVLFENVAVLTSCTGL